MAPPHSADSCSSNTSAKTWPGTWRRSRTARSLLVPPRLAVDPAGQVDPHVRAGRPQVDRLRPVRRPRVDLPRPVRRQQPHRRQVGLRRQVDKVALAPPVAPHAEVAVVVADAEVRRAFLSLRPPRPTVARRSG